MDALKGTREEWLVSLLHQKDDLGSGRDEVMRAYHFEQLLHWPGSINCYAALQAIVSCALGAEASYSAPARQWLVKKVQEDKAVLDRILPVVYESVGYRLSDYGSGKTAYAMQCLGALGVTGKHRDRFIESALEQRTLLTRIELEELGLHELPPPTRPDLVIACIMVREHWKVSKFPADQAQRFMDEPNLAEMPLLREAIINQCVFNPSVDQGRMGQQLAGVLEIFLPEIVEAIKDGPYERMGGREFLCDLVDASFHSLNTDRQIELATALTKGLQVGYPVFTIAPTICTDIVGGEIIAKILTSWISFLAKENQDERPPGIRESWIHHKDKERVLPEIRKRSRAGIKAIIKRLGRKTLVEVIAKLQHDFHRGQYCEAKAYGYVTGPIVERLHEDQDGFAKLLAPVIAKGHMSHHLLLPIVRELGVDKVRAGFQSWLDLRCGTIDAYQDRGKALIKTLLYDFIIPHKLSAGKLLKLRMDELHKAGYELKAADLEKIRLSECVGGKDRSYKASPAIWQDARWRDLLLSNTKRQNAAVGWLMATAYQRNTPADPDASTRWLDLMLPEWNKMDEKLRQAIQIWSEGESIESLAARRYLLSKWPKLSSAERQRCKTYCLKNWEWLILNEPEALKRVGSSDLAKMFFKRRSKCGALALGDPEKLAPIFRDAEKRVYGWIGNRFHSIKPEDLIAWVEYYDFACFGAMRLKLTRLATELHVNHELRCKIVELLKPYISCSI